MLFTLMFICEIAGAQNWLKLEDFPASPAATIFPLDSASAFRKELYSYDIVNDTWQKESDFPDQAIVYVALEPVNEQVLLFGGFDTLNKIYNKISPNRPGTGNWSQASSIRGLGRRGGMSCAKANSTIAVA
jgi:hypothetical protein